MARKKTSKRPSKSGTNISKEFEKSMNKSLSDSKKVKRVLLECLAEGDLESFEDILVAHLKFTNKTSFCKKSGIGRSTLYDLLNEDKEFNPSLKTVVAILEAI